MKKFFLLASSIGLIAIACSGPGLVKRGDAGNTGGTINTGGQLNLGGTSNNTGGSGVIVEGPPTPNCGDGTRNEDEACDDGNQMNDDGCGSNCRYVETGFVCPDPGQPCRAFARCGDGILVFPEQCDDGGLAPGDGCSATCKFEIGFKCEGSPSTCSPTTCGDGILEGAETCDDSNVIPLDGCNQYCQAEPSCTSEGCTSACGDGLVIGAESCDDGNTLDGDGCSSTCVAEPGYVCMQDDSCEMLGDTCILRVPAFYRDFSADHSDFGVDCGTQLLGIVDDLLDGQGKPTLANGPTACIQSDQSFSQWFRASPPSNTEILSELVLFDNGMGAYVNRLDNEGNRYSVPPPNGGVLWCSNESDRCDQCAAGFSMCYPTCTPWGETNTQTCAEYPNNAPPIFIDGDPLFFPIDGHPNAHAPVDAYTANVPEEVYDGGWQAEAGGALHNFHFTTEVTYWFSYHTGDTANLTFVGDDDVWVFVNRRLAVDLGGLHVPIQGSFTLNADGSIDIINGSNQMMLNTRSSDIDEFGMSDGGVYEIKVFQAERKVTGSSFRLTLSGFNASRSECSPVCGDGIIGAGEQCDDGTENNVGGHNRCNMDCTLGSYCGDGIVQMPEEQCDDRDPARPANCAGCKLIIVL